MEEKNNKKKKEIKVIDLIAIVFVLAFLYALMISSYIIKKTDENNKELYKKNQNRTEISEKIEKNNELEDEKDKNKLNAEYSYNEFDTEENLDSIMEVVSYDKYIETIDKINNISTEKIKNKYTDNNVNYVILAYAKKDYYYGFDLSKCIEKTDKLW